MKKRTRLLYGLLLLCAPLAGCLKEDDGSQFYSDVYWFPLAKQTFSVDTREPEPVDTVVLVFRARNFVYDSDTVNFAVMPDSTTAVAGTDYEITTPVVRFGKDDYYDNLLRGEIGLRIYPTLSDTLTLALKLIYTHLTMPLIALTDLRAKGEQDNDPRYTALADIVDAHNGLWCPEAEEYLLANFNPED